MSKKKQSKAASRRPAPPSSLDIQPPVSGEPLGKSDAPEQNARFLVWISTPIFLLWVLLWFFNSPGYDSVLGILSLILTSATGYAVFRYRRRFKIVASVTILVLLSIVLGGSFYISWHRNTERAQHPQTPIPSSTSIPTPLPDKPGTRIVLVPFFRPEGVTDTDIHTKIRRAIEEQIRTLDLHDVEIIVASESFRDDDYKSLEDVLIKYRPDIVIWGEEYLLNKAG